MKPHIGQRVRRVAAHWGIPIGQLGTIDVVHDNNRDFWVATDDGGFCGWTTFEQWDPVTTDVIGVLIADESTKGHPTNEDRLKDPS